MSSSVAAVLAGRRQDARTAPSSPRKTSSRKSLSSPSKGIVAGRERSSSPTSLKEGVKVDWVRLPTTTYAQTKDAAGGDPQSYCSLPPQLAFATSDAWKVLRVDAHRGRHPSDPKTRPATDAEVIEACTMPSYGQSTTPDPYA